MVVDSENLDARHGRADERSYGQKGLGVVGSPGPRWPVV